VRYSSEMQTLAEIAIAMAGFAGIITALQARTFYQSSVIFARLRELLLTSIGVVFFAFIPTLLEGLLPGSRWALQGPQFLFAVYHVSLMYLFFSTAGFDEPSVWEWVAFPFAVAVVLVQFATGLGFFSDYLAEAYFLALLWLLLIAAQNFISLLLRQRESE
jgi:hypothetical protein